MRKRPPFPADLERLILVESGHRCAIHACRQAPVQIAHIIPWSRCRTHEFPNLIALCPTCHTRFDKGEIDRKSMLIYKHNAWLQSSRYSDLEKRLLTSIGTQESSEVWIFAGMALLLQELISSGYLIDTGETRPSEFPETFRERRFKLSASGKNFASAIQKSSDEA